MPHLNENQEAALRMALDSHLWFSDAKIKAQVVELMCNFSKQQSEGIRQAHEMVNAENAELKLQVEALKQSLETHTRENQPYIKDLSDRMGQANMLLLCCLRPVLRTNKPLSDKIRKHFLQEKINLSPEWIPVTERLPEPQQNCLFIVDCRSDHDNGRILGGTYTGNPDHEWSKFEFSTPGCGWNASHWSPIPDNLLNFKP